MAKGKSHDSKPLNRNNPAKGLSKGKGKDSAGTNTSTSGKGASASSQDGRGRGKSKDPYAKFFTENYAWEFRGTGTGPIGPSNRRARGGKKWSPKAHPKDKKPDSKAPSRNPSRENSPQREENLVPPPAPPVDGGGNIPPVGRLMYGIEHGASRSSSWEHRVSGITKAWPKGSLLGPGVRVGTAIRKDVQVTTSTDNVTFTAPAASHDTAGSFGSLARQWIENPLRVLGDEYLSNPPSVSFIMDELEEASRAATWSALGENLIEALGAIAEESLPSLRRALLCWWNRGRNGINAVMHAKYTVASMLQCYIAGYELKHAVQHLRENRIPIRAWVNGSLQKGENSQDVRVGLVSLNDIMTILGMSSPCVGMPTAESAKGPSAISAWGVNQQWGANQEGGATVCPDLVARLTRYAEFRPRTADLLRGLQNRAVVWCKEMGISDIDASRFRATSVALAFLVSNEEGLALGVLRTSEGHYSVDVYQRGDDGNILLATGRWSLKGLLTGKNSPLDVVLDTSVPMLRWDLMLLDSIELCTGNRTEPRYPLAYYFWSPTIRDVLSPTLTVPHK